MKNRLISIIMPNFNCEKYIEKSILSVIKQTYTDWELIIVDDCSTDSSFSIAQSWKMKDRRIHVIKNEQNSGAAYSRNRAMDIAKGEYIAFLDSDDIWVPNKLEIQLKFMEENNCDFSFCRYDLIDEEDLSLGKVAKIIDRLNFYKLLHHDFIGCLTAMYRYEIAKDVRSFLIKNNNDYGLFLQVLKHSKNARGISDTLAHYRIRKTGISRKKIKKIKPYFELMHKYLHFPYFICCWFLFTNILIGKVWKYEKR